MWPIVVSAQQSEAATVDLPAFIDVPTTRIIRARGSRFAAALGTIPGVGEGVDGAAIAIDGAAEHRDLGRGQHPAVPFLYLSDHTGACDQIDGGGLVIGNDGLEGVGGVPVSVDEQRQEALVELVEPALRVLDLPVGADREDLADDDVADSRSGRVASDETANGPGREGIGRAGSEYAPRQVLRRIRGFRVS